ncbi:MAG: sugar phosphate nucleotidyltransferase [Thermoprotei archaeon]
MISVNSTIRHAVVLCGGSGRDMEPLSVGLPKPLITLLGVDVITRILLGLKGAGIEEVVVVVQGNEQLKQRALQVGAELGLEVVVVDQGSNREVWGALLAARDPLVSRVGDGSFLLSYGDIVSTPGLYTKLIEDSSTAGYPVASVVLQKDVTTYGVVKLGINGAIERIVEKPVSLDPDLGGYVLAGSFVLPTSIFDFGAEEGFIGVLNRFANTYTLGISVWDGVWVDLGYPWDVLTASSKLLGELRQSSISVHSKVSPTAIIEPPVIIEDGATVDHHAIIRGPAYIGRGAYVGTGALVHGYSSIEEGVSIGAYAEVSGSVLGPKTWVGRGCFIGNTVVGVGVVFEPHVTTLSVLRDSERPTRLEPTIRDGKAIHKLGTVIGNGARIGANCVLYPSSRVETNSVLPPNTVVRSRM